MKRERVFVVVRYESEKDVKGAVIGSHRIFEKAAEISARFNRLHGNDWIGARPVYPFTTVMERRAAK